LQKSKIARFDAEALRTFFIVAELRSFSEAAEVLHKTTPAVSYRIKTLENSLNTQLFVRTTRTVTLTPSGAVLFAKASRIFEWMETLPQELKQADDGVESRFVLVISYLLYEADAIAALVAHLTERFPHVPLRVRQAVYMGVWDELRSQDGQVAIGVPGFDTIDHEFSTAPLGVVNWVFVVAPEHPLATAPFPLGNETLRRFPAVNIEDTALRLAKRTAWRLPGQSEIIVPDLEAKIACHVKGVGGGFVPEAKVRQLLQRRKLIKCPVVVGRQPSPLALAWRRESVGKITAYLRDLCLTRHKLVQPLFDALDPKPVDAALDEA
jgi:LysR family transcriptional activator of the allD operon